MALFISLVLGFLGAAGIVARATNQTESPPSEHQRHLILDMMEKFAHMEEKLDTSVCQLEKQQIEITERVRSFENVLHSDLEALELHLEKSTRTEISEQIASLSDRILTNIKLQLLENQAQEKVMSASLQRRPPVSNDPTDANNTDAWTPFYIAISGINDRLVSLAQRTDACAKAADQAHRERKPENASEPRMASPYEWIPIMRRINGRVNFSRDWDDYKAGFGNANIGGEFWLGLEEMSRITARLNHRLRVVLTDYSGEIKFAEYSEFYIHGENENYRLFVGGYVNGSTAGDSLAYHNGMSFTTRDRDNDRAPDGNCAKPHRGGWWYGGCDHSHLTGDYLGPADRSDKGVAWQHAYNDNRSFKGAEMSIRQE